MPVAADLTRPGRVEFKDVEFRYPGAERPYSAKISFTALPGQTTAIVGSTGSGKSTLISLMPRLYDVTSGSIKLDGLTSARWTGTSCGSTSASCRRRPFFSQARWPATCVMAMDATDEELWRALSIAQAKDFVEEMPVD